MPSSLSCTRLRSRPGRPLAVLFVGVVLAAALSPATAYSAQDAPGRLEGIVRVQGDDSAISGAIVRLLNQSDGAVVDQSTTGSAGRYSLSAPTGVYDLDVTGGPVKSRFVAKVRGVEVGSDIKLNVAVQPLMRFSGRVRDAAGTPLSGINVNTSAGSTVTATDGTFEVIGPAGTHWVQLSRSFDQSGAHRIGVLVRDVDLSEDRSADLTFPIGSTKVVVRDDLGRAVAGATASLSTYETCPDGCPVDFDVWPGETDTTTWSDVQGVTDGNGEVVFTTVPTRKLRLSAEAPAEAGLGILHRTVTVPAAGQLQAVLRSSVTLRGRLTAGFGEGIFEGKVTLENDEYRSTGGEFFGEDGSFVVKAPPGRYRLSVAADLGSYEEQQGMESWATATGAFVTLPDFELSGDRTQDLHLPTSTHTVRVVDHAGNPAPAVLSGCSGNSGIRCGWLAGRFNGEGTAPVELFPGGVGTGLLLNNGWARENGEDVWTVFAGAPLTVSASSGLLHQTVTVDGAGASTEVRLPATVRVSGTAGDSRGAFDQVGASGDAVVTIDGSDYGAWTGGGTYQLDVPPGRHTISFEDREHYDDYEEPTATLPTWWGVSVERDITGPTTLNFTVPDATAGYVRFVDAEGYPNLGNMWLQGSTLAADVPIGGGLVGRGWIRTDFISPDEHGVFSVPLFGRSTLSGYQYELPGAPWGDTRWVDLRLSPGEHLVVATAARMASADPSAPRDVSVTTYGTTLMPTWVTPEEDGGGTLTYLVTVTDPAGETRRQTTPWNVVTFSHLKPDTPYTVTVRAVNTHGTGPAVTVTATTGDAPPTTPDTAPGTPTTTNPGTGPSTTSPTPDHPGRAEPGASGATSGRPGYWALAADGKVYNFGDAPALGHTAAAAVDLEPTPTGRGYWTLNRDGNIGSFGDATALGHVDLRQLGKGEEPASLSATPSGQGYWVFTNRGRAIAFGDAPFLGDVSDVNLNGPVLDSVATPSGQGYYMVASDGGIFAFGDAAFVGSMGGQKLNAPVQSLVPDSDGKGYWLVAGDGGIFAFDAPFKGSLGGMRLNKPVVGMVRYGDGYLMVGADGGIFNFSSLPFSGSLGGNPPTSPVVAVAALPSV
ncbi:MAG: fibronectin type III domain-containing protein [Actinomycetota bacterium]